MPLDGTKLSTPESLSFSSVPFCGVLKGLVGGNIYFAGDTGYGNGDYFRVARDKFQSFRLAIVLIGDYDPRCFMAKESWDIP